MLFALEGILRNKRLCSYICSILNEKYYRQKHVFERSEFFSILEKIDRWYQRNRKRKGEKKKMEREGKKRRKGGIDVCILTHAQKSDRKWLNGNSI